MSSPIDSPAYRSQWLLIFTWGSPRQELKICDLEVGAVSRWLGTFTSCPGLQIELPALDGTLRAQPLRLTVEESISTLFTSLTTGVAPPVEVQVWEELLSPDETETQRFLHFRGQVSKAIRNYNGRRGAVRLEALGIKAQLQGTLGMPCNSQCIWELGDQNCLIEIPSEEYQIDSVTRRVLVTTLNPTGTGRFWERGWIMVDGLRIGIRNWNSSFPKIFYLSDAPPSSWAGETALFYPGCDKTIETCRSRWDNEDQFGGFGYSIPVYHPNYETPSV